MVNQLEGPNGAVLLQFEVADFQFQENFIVMKILPNPPIGLCFLQRHKALFDIRQGIVTFPYLSMQLRQESPPNTRAATLLLTGTTYTLQSGEMLAIPSKIPHLIDHNATGKVTPSSHMEEHESVFIASSLSTVNNKAVGHQVINFSDMPYSLPIDTHGPSHGRLPSFNPRTNQTHQTSWPMNPHTHDASTLTYISTNW